MRTGDTVNQTSAERSSPRAGQPASHSPSHPANHPPISTWVTRLSDSGRLITKLIFDVWTFLMVSPKSWNIQRCRAYRLPTLGQGSADTKQHGAGKCGPVKNMAVKSGLAGFMAVSSFTLKKGNPPRRKRAPFHKIEKWT